MDTSTEQQTTTENPYAVDEIFYTSWGYDQTNVEFYTVVRETKASVWLVRLSAEVRDGRLWPGMLTLWTMGPSDDDRVRSAKMHRKGKHGVYVTLDTVRTAWHYDGGGKYDTFAAGQAGH